MIEEVKLNEFDTRYSIKDIGYVIIRKLYEHLDITDVFVEENFRRQGYAYKILSYIIENNQNYKIMLEVNEENIPAINLYKKLGFKKISERANYYKDKTALIMEYSKDVYILAIESSCDETSVSIVKNGTEDIATVINSQIDIHKNYGGVVPEIASRKHMENITIVLDECLSKANMKFEDMDAFACTYAPGLTGSLLVGLECAKTLSLIYNKPFIKVNHMLGHISANKINNELKYPLISLIVSGGHTDLIYMKDENTSKYLGSTLDDAIGECYDKVAKILGLEYPGGPNVERLALKGNNTYKMPTILNDESYNFSFSGIKSHINNLVHNEHQRGNEVNKEDLCKSFQDAVTNLLVSKTKKSLIDYKVKYLLIAGGVASNSHIREELTKMCKSINVEIHIPDKKYCTDNATMIGAAAYPLYLKKEFSPLDTNAKSNENI